VFYGIFFALDSARMALNGPTIIGTGSYIVLRTI